MKHDSEHDDELGDVMRSVDDLAAFEAELIESAGRIEAAPGAERVQATLDAAFGVDRPQSASRWVPLGAAAAVLLALGFWWGLRPSEETQEVPVGPSGTYLNDGAFGFVDPVRTSDGWTLAWRGPELGEYELTAVDNTSGEELLGPVSLTTREHVLSSDKIREWPNEVFLELKLLDADRRIVDTVSTVLVLDGSR